MKLAIGIAFGVLVLALGQYFFLPEWYRGPGIKASGWLIMVSVAMGITLSIMLLVYVIKKLLEGKPFDLFGLSATAHTGSKVGSYLMAFVSYPFALFLGFIVGGNFGGGLGGEVANAGVVVGIGVGVFAVTALIGIIATLIGFVLGGFAEKLTKQA